MKRLILPVVVSLLFPVAGFAFEVGVKAAYWIPEFSGSFRLDGGGVQGTRLDFKDDLAVNDENFAFGEAWLWVGRHHLTLSGMEVDYSGDETLAKEIVFGGTTFVANGAVESRLEYTMLDLAYQFDLLDLENVLAGFSVGPIVQVKYLDGEVKMSGEGQINGATGQVKESESFQFPIPLLGLGAHVGILADFLEVRARIVGLTYQGDWLYEAQGEVTFSPFPFIEIVGGYRRFDIDVDRDDVLLDYTQTGPYAGVSVKI
jgi:hypothetical protein